MKSIKYLLIALAAVAFTSCEEPLPKGTDTKKPTGEEQPTTKPDTPTEDPKPENVVSPQPTFSCATEVVKINTNTTYQEWEGFAASDCWLGDWIGRYWMSGRKQIADMLFSKKIVNGQPQGIGLSMWRVNLGGGSAEQGAASKLVNETSRAEAYLSPTGQYNWDKCAGQRYFMQQAKLNGVEKFVFFCNSPLVQFTKNGLATKIGSKGNWSTNLKDDSYAPFAEYLATVCKHFEDQGYNITHISPANEPQYEWNGDNQEGSSWLNPEMARMARELQKALDAKGSKAGILMGEAGSFVSLYKDNDYNHNMIQNFFDKNYKNGESYIGDQSRVGNLICGHSYWTNNTWASMRDVRKQLANKAKEYGVRVWQTEWSLLGDSPADLGTYESNKQFDLAMYMSRVIHCDLAVAECTSWSYWTAMSVERYSQMNRFELIFTTPANGHYDNNWTVEGSVADNPNLWVLGNYSLFIRPGYRRVEVVHNETKDFFTTAWISPDGKTLACVYTNYNKDKGVRLDISGSKLPGTPSKIWRYTTTSEKKLKGEQFKPTDGVFVEPSSVTTVVYEFNQTSAL